MALTGVCTQNRDPEWHRNLLAAELRPLKGLQRKQRMVGTGRFELPNSSCRARAPSQGFYSCASASLLRSLWGASWVGTQVPYKPLKGLQRKQRMVGTGRFELPTPRTPSECSTRLSHVPTRGKALFRQLGVSLIIAPVGEGQVPRAKSCFSAAARTLSAARNQSRRNRPPSALPRIAGLRASRAGAGIR